MAERTDPTHKKNHPFYCQYRTVYEYATQWAHAQQVLDIGCGEGYGAHLLAQHAKMVIAIDKHKETILKALQRYSLPNLCFAAQTVEQLANYTPNSFDLACCFHTIEHIKEPTHALVNIAKLLANTGTLLISTPNKHSPFRSATQMEWPYHEREYTVAEFQQLLSPHFKTVTLYALQASDKVQQFQNVRARYLQQIFKWDILRLRKWLPKRLLQLSFDIGGKLLKSFLNTTHSSMMTSITLTDFHVTDKNLHNGLDLIGVCRTPKL